MYFWQPVAWPHHTSTLEVSKAGHTRGNFVVEGSNKVAACMACFSLHLAPPPSFSVNNPVHAQLISVHGASLWYDCVSVAVALGPGESGEQQGAVSGDGVPAAEERDGAAGCSEQDTAADQRTAEQGLLRVVCSSTYVDKSWRLLSLVIAKQKSIGLQNIGFFFHNKETLVLKI